VGRTIQSIKLPPGTTIGAIVRQEEVLIAHSDTKIETEDHVILFLVNKRYISDVEKLFHVDALTFY
jgi:trk system potassium uptake protein TrkA